jgi:phosphoribosylformimino-5-aminoimidazole carboxamide ribotide isomerase
VPQLSGLTLYPAIDVLGGRVVRLEQGDYARDTVYGADPVTVARRFEREGAAWIHVVDLDAARDGVARNLEVVEAICATVGCRVQTGGGVRSVADATDRLAAGAHRVVIGTPATATSRSTAGPRPPAPTSSSSRGASTTRASPGWS